MVNLLAIFLLLVESVRKLRVADKLVNNRFKDDIEVFGKQKFIELCIDAHVLRLVKEREAQIP